MTKNCIFCKIISGEIPAEFVKKNQFLTAFRDINPAAPQHVLIIPNRHIASINQTATADNALLGSLLTMAREIASQEGFAENGYRLVINTGEDGGQTVHHLHLHLLGGRQLHWPPG